MSEETNNKSACDDTIPDSTTQADSGAGKLRRRSRSSTFHRSGSFSDVRAQPRIALRGIRSSLRNYDGVCLEPAGDTHTLRQCCCIEGSKDTTSKDTTETSHCTEKMRHLECHNTLLFPYASKFSPQNASFHHSTPEDKDSSATYMMSGTESESMCLSKDDGPYEDIDVSVVVRNALSWHDSVNVEPSPSRSCMSLDDAVFLRDLNVDGSNETEVLATCTAVSSLEQLEQEVAGVLSDCGDMERCFGMLRRRDSVKAVVGRYSLGVADTVLAGDKCARWQESMDASIIDELSLSSSLGIVRNSGFLWDNNGIDADSPSMGFVPVNRRATRSLSPLPSLRRQANDIHDSLSNCADSQVNGSILDWTDVDNTSTDLGPCTVYDVNRRLSGRLHI